MSEERRHHTQPWSFEDLDELYDTAVCHGAAVAGEGAGDQHHSPPPIALLASSTIHVPNLVILIMALEEAADTGDVALTAAVAREVENRSAGLIRLGQRALEAHATDVGYDPSMWHDEVVSQTAVALSVGVSRGAAAGLELAALELQRATVALADAIAAVPTDRMAVPSYLASALSGWLGCYVRAAELATPSH